MSEPDDTDALLASLEREARPMMVIHGFGTDDFKAVLQFIHANELRAGRVVGVEPCTLYRFYLAWHEGHVAGEPVRPFSFTKQLRKHGFSRRGRTNQHRGDEARPICMHPESARRLIAWRGEHPDTVEGKAKWLTHFQFGNKETT